MTYPEPKPDHSYKIIAIGIIVLLIVVAICHKQARGEPEICIPCIITIESSRNPNAYNKKSGAIGLMQITPIVLEEFNRYYIDDFRKLPNQQNGNYILNSEDINSINKYDLYNYQINMLVGTWYLNRIKNHYLKGKGTIEDILICYHDGYGNWKKYKQGKRKLGKEMKAYLKKYFAVAKGE